MAKNKNKVPANPDGSSTQNSTNKIRAFASILSLPFWSPAAILNGGLSGAGLGAGAVILALIIGVGVYFGVSYGISRSYPKKNIMKYSFLIWLIGIVLAFIYLKTQENLKKSNQSIPYAEVDGMPSKKL